MTKFLEWFEESPFMSLLGVIMSLAVFAGIAFIFKFFDKIITWINNL